MSEKSESIKELASALSKAQGVFENPAFDAKNPHFKSDYASLASVRNAVMPVLSTHGLALLQLLGNTEAGEISCETLLTHESGEWISNVFCIKPTKPDAHGAGSAATYARRYSMMAILGVVGDDDDDGNIAVEKQPQKIQPKEKTEAPPKNKPNKQQPAKPAIPAKKLSPEEFASKWDKLSAEQLQTWTDKYWSVAEQNFDGDPEGLTKTSSYLADRWAEIKAEKTSV
jgi:hypothetical protein